MKSKLRLLGLILAVLVIVIPGASSYAASPTPTPTPGATTQTEVYLTGLFMPTNNPMIGGATALIGQNGTSNGNEPGEVQPTKGQPAAGQNLFGLQLSGLKPSGAYSAVISSAGCGNTGNAQPRQAIQANPDGDVMFVGTTSYTIRANTKISVVLQEKTGATVACAALNSPSKVVNLTPMMMSGKSSGAKGMGVAGVALITYNTPVLNGKVKSGTSVIVYASGLQKSTVQPNHIHAGPCGTSSTILFPLNTLVSNAQGRGIEGTGIPYNLKGTTGSVHIHANSFAPEACGNLTS